MYSEKEERLNTLSHGVASIATLVMLVFMLLKVANKPLSVKTAMLIFCIMNCLVYLSSTVYHGIKDIKAKIIAQKIDHAMVSLIILGTAVPTLLLASKGIVANAMLIAVFVVTVCNIIVNFISVQKYKKISQALYVLGLFFIVIGMFNKVQLPIGFWLIFLSGVAVIVVGGYFYLQKRKIYTHFVWHISDIVCTTLHFLAFYIYLA